MIIPVCSTGQLAQIALGLTLDKITDLVSWAIKTNIPVEIGSINEEFTERTPSVYCDLFTKYLQQAAAYGVMIGKKAQSAVQPVAAEAETALLPTSENAFAADSDLVPWSFTIDVKKADPVSVDRQEISFTKRLFSIKEAMTVPLYAILHVARGTVLTPSAIDQLKGNKVQVFREGVQCL